MSKAIRIHRTGGPEVLQLEDVEVGDPGAGQIKIRHRAIGLNFIEVYFRKGVYPAELPFTPGNEGAGDVVAVGKGVKTFKVGDRVGYAAQPGSYAEERLIGAQLVVKLPAAIGYETGAAMMLKGLTAQYLLRRTYRVKEGDTMLVHAAAGGVGNLLCQWGKHLGATVIGTVGSEAKAKLAKKAGAKHVINYSTENFVERVAEITKGREMRRRLRRRRQGDVSGLARLSAAAGHVRLLRIGVGADRRFQYRVAESEGVVVRDPPDPVSLYRRA